MAEIAANPDEDAPRLVWADLVGGERGELVVIQCDLARGGLSPPEARARRVRERELLEANAVAWSDGIVAKRWAFRRGFIEAARFTVTPDLAAWPLVRSVTIDHWQPGVVHGLDRTRALGVVHLAYAARLPILDELRALCAYELESVLPVIDLATAAPLETLRLRMHRLRPFEVETLLGAAPQITALELGCMAVRDNDGVDVAAQHPLRALQLGISRTRTIGHLRDSAAAASLEHFGFDLHGEPVELADILSGMPRVRTLDIGGNAEPAVHAIADATLPALELLRVRGNVSAGALRRLAHVHVDISTYEGELVHASPHAMGVLGRPWCAWTKPAVLARFDRHEILDIPAVPVDEVISLGRGINVTVRVTSGTVARRHAAIRWQNDAHVIEDLRSTNGTEVNRERIQSATLRDGDLVCMGDAQMRYFVGDGAQDRAIAALGERSGQ